jgi:hypothetical protein
MQDVLLWLLGGQPPGRPAGPGNGGVSMAPGRPAGGGGVSTVPGRRRRGSGTVVVAVVSGVGALAVAGAVAWVATSLPFQQQRPSTQALAFTSAGTPARTSTSAPAATPTSTKSKSPQPPKKSKSPSPSEPASTPKPTVKKTVKPTQPAPKPTTASAKPSSGGGSFRVVWIRAMGARKANTQDCQIGQTNTFGLVEGTKLATRFHYEWVLDGRVVQRSESVIAESHTMQVVGPLVTSNGPHRITLRVTSPATASKAFSFTVCPVGTE